MTGRRDKQSPEAPETATGGRQTGQEAGSGARDAQTPERASDGRAEARVHDFGPGRRRWGHDYTITKVLDGGQQLKATGWGHDGRMIREGDYLLLEGSGRASRYQVTGIRREMDPGDMWHADLTFAPRIYASQAEKDATR